MNRSRLPVLLVLFAAACGPDPIEAIPSDGTPRLDGGVRRDAAVLPDLDAGGELDAGPADAAEPPDAAFEPDAGPEDAGEIDAGEPDAGLPDGGELDAGTIDAGEEDAGELDAGEPDAGEPDAGLPDAGPQPFSFAVISDVHIGKGSDPYSGQEDTTTANARSAVARINQLAATENLAFVFVAGDLTDSAEESEFAKADEILRGLQVPWFPLIGNHDLWRFVSWTDRDSTAVADATFARYFADRFSNVSVGAVEYVDAPVWNPELGHESRFQNFELRYQGYVFLGLDWNSRKAGIYPVRGAAPEADLHDFPGGTLPWFRQRLAQVPPETKRVFIVQHQGIKGSVVQPAFYFTFTGGEATTYEGALTQAWPRPMYWGLFAGHAHRRWQGAAFDDWPEFQQMETDSCADNAEVTVVRVGVDGSVTVDTAP